MPKKPSIKTAFFNLGLLLIAAGCSEPLQTGSNGEGGDEVAIFQGSGETRDPGATGSNDGTDGTDGANGADDAAEPSPSDGNDDNAEGNGPIDASGGNGEGENQDADGYCFDPEVGYFPCDDGAPPANPDQNDTQVVGGTDADPSQGGDTGVGGDDPSGGGNDPVPGNEDPPPPSSPPPPGTSEPECGQDVFNQDDRLPPRILLVVDKSGSMDEGAVGYPGSKWQGLKSALTQVVGTLDSEAELGLMLFPNGTSSNGMCEAGRVFNPVGNGQGSNILGTLDATGPGGGTPTAPSLSQAKIALTAIGEEGGTRAIILATDGGPNCNQNLNSSICRCVNPNGCSDSRNCLDDADTLAAVEDVNAGGFSTFVVGIPGSENFTDVLSGMAEAGGTANGSTGYYDASDADALASAVEAIASRLANCRFDLQGSALNVDDMAVSVGGIQVPRDTNRQNGWDMVDNDTLEVFGNYCDNLAADTAVSLNVDYCFVPDFV
jgi:hypothetical protein